MWKIEQADILDWCSQYKGEPFHAVLCDPPYDWAFMNKSWDSGIAMHPETWAAIAEHLYPGAFIMAFGGPRTYHRLAVAMEDAGLRIHPALGWLTGQGFCKATRIDTQVDKGDAREEKRRREYRFTAWMRSTGITARQIDEVTDSCMGHHYTTHPTQPAIATAEMFDKLRPLLPEVPEWVEEYVKQRTIESKRFAERETVGKLFAPASSIYGTEMDSEVDITAPATALARVWEGHRYGLQCLRPCLEFIAVAQKPYAGKPVECITETGAGAIWVDGGRIGHTPACEGKWGATQNTRPGYGGQGWSGHPSRRNPLGRWPANVALAHSPECVRVGVRRVKSSVGWTEKDRDVPTPAIFKGGLKKRANSPMTYADSDGLETVDDWLCVESCPVHRLETLVDKPTFLRYNEEKREVNQCCRDVSIAVASSMLGDLTSSEGLGDSVVENVAMRLEENGARLTLGGNVTNAMGVGIDFGAIQAVGSYIASLKIDGSLHSDGSLDLAGSLVDCGSLRNSGPLP